jgi:hypothetical protein
VYVDWLQGALKPEKETDPGLHRVQLVRDFLMQVWSWVKVRPRC